MAWPVSVLVENALACDLALVRQLRLPHAGTFAGARANRPLWDPGTLVHAVGELVDHHALEDPFLVIPVVEDIPIKDIEDSGLNEESTNGHPEAIGECNEGQRRHE